MELKYRRTEKGWICTGVEPIDYAGDVVTPEEHEGRPVVGLADKAFAGCKLTRIHIANGIGEIPPGCFQECPNLTEVTFGEGSSLKAVHCGAFALKGQKISIRFPIGLQNIGSCAFSNAEVAVQIPEGCNVSYMGFDAVAGCRGRVEQYDAGLGPVERDENKNEFRLNREKTGYIITKLGRFRDSMGYGRVPDSFNGLPVVELGRKFCTDPYIGGCHVPATVKGGGHMPFYGCDGMSCVIYGGTRAEWTATGIWFWETVVCEDGRFYEGRAED